MNRTIQALMQFFVLGTCGLVVSHVVYAAEPRDPRLEKVLADWQKRQHWFQTVKYEVSGIHKVPKGAYSNLPAAVSGIPPGRISPPRDVEATVSFTILLDFVKGRHRRESTERRFDASSGSLTPLVTTDVFNGSVMKCFMPREENAKYKVGISQPDMSITSGNMKFGEFVSTYFPFSFAHGRIYTAMEPILPGQLRNKPDSEYLFVHGTGVYDEHPCLIVRTQTLKMATTSFDEYWVDTKRESAIMRYLAYSGDKPAQEIGIRYRKSHDHWLPDSWRKTEYDGGKISSYEEIRVDKIAVNPPVTDADFELEIKPGMLVEEATVFPTDNPIVTPKFKVSVYRVKDDGKRQAIPDPFHRPNDQYQEQQRNEQRPRRLVRFGLQSSLSWGL